RLAELSPKFTIAVFPRQIYVNELTAEIGTQVGNFNSKYPGSVGDTSGQKLACCIASALLPLTYKTSVFLEGATNLIITLSTN
ncbi:MAG TPA: hypothetical protein VIQ31_02610, partial [Phormidium sp.]